ncbi:MAG: PilZ domain-containing protein [Myxococcota bacterium]
MSEWAPPDGRPDILVVDPLVLYRELEAHYLSRIGRVRTAGNAAAAMRSIELRRPHVAIVSLDLADRPGEELVAELRESPRTAAIPVVALTRGSPAEHARAVRAGASDILTRPLAHSLLVETVDRLLATPYGPQGLPRAPVKRPVRFWDLAHISSGVLRNVSRGGCFVESDDWLPSEGHELNLDFALPGFPGTFALTAQLVWRRLLPSRGRRGAGLRFLELDGGTARALGHYVETVQGHGPTPLLAGGA